jgi:hypothetical protein
MTVARAIATLLFACCSSAFADEVKVPSALAKQIRSLEQLISDGISTPRPEYRHYLFARPNQNGAGAIAVATFELDDFRGGNNWKEYLAVFERFDREPDIRQGKGKHYVERWSLLAFTPVGGYRKLDPGSISLVDAGNASRYSLIVRLGTQEYQGTDARCCPTGKGYAVFRINEYGHLEELKEADKKRYLP